MTKPQLTLRKADAADIDRITTLLDANDLPSRDVRTSPGRFFIAYAGEEFVGIGGIEAYGQHGLLRSVVVTASNRGQGYGSALCDALETRARTKGVGTIFLLTTTATAFFRRCGYDEVARDAVPPSIRRTAEFTELCPDSATCLRKNL